MVQTRAIATGVAIIGSTNMVRASPRNLKFEAKQTAAQTPSISGAMTDAAVNTECRTTAHWKRSSCSMWVSLASPTNGVAPLTFHSCTDMNRVNTQGNRITTTTMIAAGTAKTQVPGAHGFGPDPISRARGTGRYSAGRRNGSAHAGGRP